MSVPDATPRSSPPAWVADAVFYQIFPDRFAPSPRVPKPPYLEPWDDIPTRDGFKGGDLLGVVERLDHLEELGANAIYLNPVFTAASNHRYNTYDYFQVDPLLGGNDALRELLDQAHARGMRVILDGVFNHSGRGFWPFHHVLECGEQSPYRDWFLVEGFPPDAYGRGRRANYAAWWGLRGLPKLNLSNPETRAYVLDVAEHWMRFGADGWRLDVPTEVDVPGFWEELRARVRAVNSEAYLVGEIWYEAPEWLHGDRFDALMNYPLARAVLGFTGRALRRDLRQGKHRIRRLRAGAALRALTRHTAVYPESVVRAQLNLLGSHDCPRILTHLGGDTTAVHLAVALQMTLPGAPCIYYGDEVGMEGEDDPDCRRAFPWDRSRWHLPTWEAHRGLVALRRAEPTLRHGDFRALRGGGGDTIAYARSGGRRAVVVVVNASDADTSLRFAVPDDLHPSGAIEHLWGEEHPPLGITRRRGRSAALDVHLPPRSARVVGWRVSSMPGTAGDHAT